MDQVHHRYLTSLYLIATLILTLLVHLPEATQSAQLTTSTCTPPPPLSPSATTMSKKILITGATDGIGLETAKMLVAAGHTVLLHGRSKRKITAAVSTIKAGAPSAQLETFQADLSDLRAVDTFAQSVLSKHSSLDVLINNAGVMATVPSTAPSGLDLHFVVNAIAPYKLTRLLQPALQQSQNPKARVVNLSSAAQSPVNVAALTKATLNPTAPFEAYAQSKLAITMWSKHLADEFARSPTGPVVIAVNPGSMLRTKMVRDGMGYSSGPSPQVGARVLCRAAVDDDFANANGKYFNNDAGSFGSPHRHATDAQKNRVMVQQIEEIMEEYK